MTTQDKRYPAYTDTDPISFGKHKGEPLQDVPPHYLVWLWREELNKYSKNLDNSQLDIYKAQIIAKIKLANYIWNSKAAIEREIGDTF